MSGIGSAVVAAAATAGGGSQSGMNLSQEFFELLKSIGESKSKQEEDRIMSREIVRLKAKMEIPTHAGSGTAAGAATNVWQSKKRTKEFLVRLLYVEMLGHDASFGYIKAVELAASQNLYHKRTGYLVCSVALPPTHEFRFMLVNQMQRDLQSTNVLEVCGGLIASCNLITADMVPAMHLLVTKLLKHDSPTIRKKAMITLHRFYQLSSETGAEVLTFQDVIGHVRLMLCDKDPAVMGSTLNVLEVLARVPPSSAAAAGAGEVSTNLKELVPSLVSILKQINEHRLPSDYDYHRVPAVWIQCKILRILSVLGKGDQATSNQMYEIVRETANKADSYGINAGYAILYEACRCMIQIYPSTTLLDLAAASISRFITNTKSQNLKYLGITGLSWMVHEGYTTYAAPHQMAVLDCLEDFSDETIQRKTLDLLYKMTNPVNVEFITEKLVAFLSQPRTDAHLKRLLTQRVCIVAEKYAPNNAWYVRTITNLMKIHGCGDLIPASVAHNLMTLIAEGSGDGNEEADMLLRQNAVEIYVGLFVNEDSTSSTPVGSLPKILLETAAWCLGEYGYLSAISSVHDIILYLCTLVKHDKNKLAASTKKMVVTSIMKLVTQLGTCPPDAAMVIDLYTRSADMDLQQRCMEFQNLLTTSPAWLPQILPVDASAEDIQVDTSLSFLNGFVQNAIHQLGAQPYSKPEMDDDDDYDDDDDKLYGRSPATTTSGFKMTPYEKPLPPSQARLAMMAAQHTPGVSLPPGAVPSGAGPAALPATQQLQQPSVGGLALNTRNVANVWGKPAPAAAAAAPAPPPAAPSPAWQNHHAPGPSSATPASSGGFYGGMSGSGGAAAHVSSAAPQKSAEQLEKERKAAALFGGVVPGVVPPTPPSAAAQPVAVRRAAAAALPVAAAPPPAADVDLLDLGGWDAGPATTPAAPSQVDVFSAPAATTVETVSDDEDLVPSPTPAPPPAPPVADLDPFADAGLLGDLPQQKTLSSSFGSSPSRFEYSGTPLAPSKITTAQFGQQWGSCPHSSPVAISSPKVSTLTQFMDVCSTAGLHPVEAIATTNEGICAGMISGTHLVLVHGKVSSARIDLTIKSTDGGLGGALALYLQTQLR
jgi:AP-4 complex subunit epsilon-1